MRRLLSAGAVALTVVATVVVLTGGEPQHGFYVVVPDASNVVSGQQIRAAGRPVGSVTSVRAAQNGSAVRVGLQVDDRAWPLPGGTTMLLRWGGTVSYSNRYIALSRGTGTGSALSPGGELPAAAFRVPAEFDDLTRTFTPRVRSDVRDALIKSGAALDTAAPNLRRSLDEAPGALEQASFVTRQLSTDRDRLATLIRSSDAVIGAVHAADPGLGPLVQGADQTAQVIADRANDVQASLTALPSTLARTRTTMARLDGTLDTANDTVTRLGPGVQQLRTLAAPLSHALTTLDAVGPDARNTLTTLRQAAPDIDGLLSNATNLSPRITAVGRQADTALNCIRPYAPEIANLISTWGSILGNYDGKDHYLRANLANFIASPTNTSTQTPAQIVAANPGLRYAFPMPPGYLAAQPWLLPQCGAGASALDAAKDLEATG